MSRSHRSACCASTARSQADSDRAGVVGVEADVQLAPRLGRNHVGHRIADVDGGELQAGWLEPVVASVERGGRQGVHERGPAGASGCRRDGDRRRGPGPWTVILALRLPRRPILIMSPSVTGQVGSPTMQKSGIWSFACIHSRTCTVPSTAGPSSSPVISSDRAAWRSVREMQRGSGDEGRDGALHVAGAAAIEHAVADLAAEGSVASSRHRGAPRQCGRQSRCAAAGP